MKRWFIIALALAAGLGLPLEAADLTATVAAVQGKVQYQKGADWLPVSVGQTLPLGTTVSTGFRSELQLKIGPSTVTVKALSRLKVESLVQDGATTKTDLYLTVGKISAEVNKNETVQDQKFTVKSAVATASVRGTVFDFDGVNLRVYRGLVDFIDGSGRVLNVPVGEAARAAWSTPAKPTADAGLLAEQLTVQANASSDYDLSDFSSQDWTDSFSNMSYEDLLALLSNYDWSGELPNVHLSIRGITP